MEQVTPSANATTVSPLLASTHVVAQAEFERQVAQLQTMATALAGSLSLSPSPTALTAHMSGTSPHSHISRQSPSYGYPAAVAAAAAARPPGGSVTTSIPLPTAGRESSKPRSRSWPATSAAHAAGGAHAGAHTDLQTAAQAAAQSAGKVAAEGNAGQASTTDRDLSHPLEDATTPEVASAVIPAEVGCAVAMLSMSCPAGQGQFLCC